MRRIAQLSPAALCVLILATAGCGSDGGGTADVATDTADSRSDSTVDDTADDIGQDTADTETVDADTAGADTVEVDTTPATDTTPGKMDCEAVAAMTLPASFSTLRDFSGSEDFAFDLDGNIVSTDQFGNLVRQTMDGSTSVFLPNVGITAGTGFLSNGDLILASVDAGELWRVTPEGGRTTLLSGLLYPNGLDIDRDGFIYIAEQDGGRVRRVDSETGEFTILADGLANANGVSFGPGYDTLYVGSFGGGVVWVMDRTRDGEWGEAREFARTPDAPGPAVDPCDFVGEGTACFVLSAYSIGKCERLLDSAGCALDSDALDLWSTVVTPCFARAIGDPCSFTLGGTTQSGTCESEGQWKTCVTPVDYATPCAGAIADDACVLYRFGLAFGGRCQPGSELDPGRALEPDTQYCVTPDIDDTPPGGLDGLNVDACGYVYVTEFTKGVVWRFAPDGGDAELVMDPDTDWIPNMHFGRGVGGWEEQTLYFMDRQRGRIFGLALPVPGKQAVGE